MLVLTRSINERLFIGSKGEVTIKVISIVGNQVRLGIEAPREVEVHREEIFNRLHGFNRIHGKTEKEGNR
jgi:carbon storage regulator